MTTFQIVLTIVVWFIGLFPAAFLVAYLNKNWKDIYLSNLEKDDDYVEPIMAFYVILWPALYIIGIGYLIGKLIIMLIEMFERLLDKKRRQLS